MLQLLADDLWAVAHDVFLPGGMHFPGRMLVVRLPSGSLVLISPVPIGDGLAAELADLGSVGFVVAPNKFHHLFIDQAQARYPHARVLAAPGLADKRPDLDLAHELRDQAPADWQDQLVPVFVEGQPAINEVVLLHVPSRTLIVTDLVFNMHQWQGWVTGLVLRLIGCHKRLAQSYTERLMTRDKAAGAASARRILALDFDRLVMAHGDIVETGGRPALAQALAPMLGGPKALEAAAAG